MSRSETLSGPDGAIVDSFEPHNRSVFELYELDRKERYTMATLSFNGIAAHPESDHPTHPLLSRLTEGNPDIDEEMRSLADRVKAAMVGNPDVKKSGPYWKWETSIEVGGHRKRVTASTIGFDSPAKSPRLSLQIEGIKPYAVIDDDGARTQMDHRDPSSRMVFNQYDRLFWSRGLNAFVASKTTSLGQKD